MIKVSKIKEILKIDDTNLNYELKRQAELLYWLGSEVDELDSVISQKRDEFGYREARKASAIRKIAVANGEKLTEKCLAEKLLCSKELRALKSELIDLRKAFNNLKTAHKSLIAKGSSLEQISFNQRKEIDFNIRKQALKDRINNKVTRRN